MKHILLTGGTGVIGSALVPRLLSEPNDCIHLVVRAGSQHELNQRASSLFRYWREGDPSFKEGRIRFYCGDVCKPNLGLDAEDYERLACTISHIVHCAGNVKLNQSLDMARRDAVFSASEIVKFSRRAMGRGGLEKIEVVSTIGVAGRMPGVVRESRLREKRGFHNTYEAAKAEAEELFWREIEEGAPLTIHRPSMIVGDSTTGRIIRFQVFYYLIRFLTGEMTGGFLPRFGNSSLDVIPVDKVADAITLSLHSQDAIGKVFHLCSGPELSLTLEELCQLIRRRFEESKTLPRIKRLPLSLAMLLARSTKVVTTGAMRRKLATLPFFLDYLRSTQCFSTKETMSYFSQRNCVLTHPSAYLRNVLGYFERMTTSQ